MPSCMCVLTLRCETQGSLTQVCLQTCRFAALLLHDTTCCSQQVHGHHCICVRLARLSKARSFLESRDSREEHVNTPGIGATKVFDHSLNSVIEPGVIVCIVIGPGVVFRIVFYRRRSFYLELNIYYYILEGVD